jgi:hypothetical protein
MPIFGLTIFAGAFLLFQVQPLIGKYILPWFGGSPSVWTTCMLFFQVALLAGYAYAHLLSTKVKLKWQSLVHLVLVALALCLLPIIPSDAWKPQNPSDPTFHIIALLACTIGLPYFALAATSPLLQHWFARTHPSRSPYRLYALSNAGSLLALATFPTLFEPYLTRRHQAWFWAAGLGLYALGMLACAWRMWNAPDKLAAPISSLSSRRGGPTVAHGKLDASSSTRRWVYWLLLPGCASVLLLATTNKMCQEVAVVPFLWVVPLGLYLLSFIICFESPRWYRRFPFGVALVAVFAGVVWALFHWSDVSVPAQMGIYAAACFICCMVCHGEVYRLKPDPQHLTAFYLMLALGGALGGIFVGVVAPLIFNDYFELQWGLALCGLLFLVLVGQDWRAGRLACWRWKPRRMPNWGAAACTALAVAWVAMVAGFWVQAHQQGPITLTKTRNFYGVLTIFERTDPGSGSKFAKLNHGRTTHGLQFRDPARAAWPTMYYPERSGVGLALQALPTGPRRIGVVGLGVGTLATYARTDDYLRLYEINPEVVRLAESQFTYLTNCHARTDVVLGDARLSLEREPPQQFDLLVLDAFSSDAIPVHLLTFEAFTNYQRHVKSDGIIAAHISNQSLDLEPVLAAVASRLGYDATLVDYRPPPEKWWDCRSKWILLAHAQTALRLNQECKDARPARADPDHVPLWTDDFTSLFPIFWRQSAWEITPSTAELELQAALKASQQSDVAAAVAHYREALASEPDLMMALNNLAWILATNPDPSLRNGPEAIKHARRACELTNFRTTIFVGTLAAAYAEAGQFSQAVSTAETACRLAADSGDSALLQKNQQLLQLYRASKPVRE